MTPVHYTKICMVSVLNNCIWCARNLNMTFHVILFITSLHIVTNVQCELHLYALLIKNTFRVSASLCFLYPRYIHCVIWLCIALLSAINQDFLCSDNAHFPLAVGSEKQSMTMYNHHISKG